MTSPSRSGQGSINKGNTVLAVKDPHSSMVIGLVRNDCRMRQIVLCPYLI